jgi:hypothetical protein
VAWNDAADPGGIVEGPEIDMFSGIRDEEVADRRTGVPVEELDDGPHAGRAAISISAATIVARLVRPPLTNGFPHGVTLTLDTTPGASETGQRTGQ